MKNIILTLLASLFLLSCADAQKDVAEKMAMKKVIENLKDSINTLNSELEAFKGINKKKKYGVVTTLADGVRVESVNVWSSTENDRKKVASCYNNETVEILGFSGYYVNIKKSDGKSGWFMKEWIKQYK